MSEELRGGPVSEGARGEPRAAFDEPRAAFVGDGARGESRTALGEPRAAFGGSGARGEPRAAGGRDEVVRKVPPRSYARDATTLGRHGAWRKDVPPCSRGVDAPLEAVHEIVSVSEEQLCHLTEHVGKVSGARSETL